MEASQTLNLYITYVEKEGPFLKVWGQTEKNNSIYVEQFLLGASPQFELGVGKVLLENLQVGTLICAKYKDNKYYRARITNISFLQEGLVEVSFLDYGNKDVVPCANIRSLQSFPSSFISIPPLATGFIFAEAHCPGGGEWNDTIFDNISKEIKYREVQCTLLIQATQYFLIKIFIGGTDLCGMLISRGLMQPISLQAQQAVLLSMSMQRQSLPLSHSSAPPSAGINTYKACTLEPGCQYPVYVSYVNDGPCHFSVQLKQSEDVLVMLMNDINTIALRLLEDIPIPGTICLSRCQEDGNICRAVVTNEVDNQFKVFYVDFGNYEVVPLDSLYQIPFKYVIPKVMAIRFSLAGVEKSTVTLEMQCAFKQFVDNRLLHMKVLPTPTRTAIPKCELWDPETKTSALDVVNRAARHAYPEPISLNRGISQAVKVSFVYSCNRFYVQLSTKENELLRLMLDLQTSCQTNDVMDPASIKIGLPCCALFEADEQWYRSQIVEVLGESVKVRYIDYGNEEIVPITQLKIIDGEQLTVLRPQAIECCLNGYQNMGEDIERDRILEELILEGQFTMKVVEMANKKALVELFDSNNYNVSSLLLDKLAAAKSQVSPMLVQAGNKIEHRKSFSQQRSPRDENYRQDRKPGRDFKHYERTNDRTEKPWRQDNKDYRNHDKYSNENTDRGSWRDNNKGFSPNSERYKNRDNRDNNRDNYRDRNRNDRPSKPNFTEDTNSWDTPATENPAPTTDDWGASTENTAPSNSRANNFDRGKSRFDSDKENWNSGGQRGGYRKRNDFRKDGSEISSSGSEKSFHKGPRTSSRNDRPDRQDRPRFQKKFDKPRNAPFNSSLTNDSWNVSAVSAIDAAPATASFSPYEVVGTESRVVISWFHNPAHFFCQLADSQEQFKSLMDEIQQFYKSRSPQTSVVGAPIVGLFPEDNVLYRAQVLEVIGPQYKVFYVDFGNVSTIDKVWPIEKKFMSLPAQAIICSLSGIGPPDGQWPDADNYSKYFDKDEFICKFVNKDEERTYINLFYGNDDIAQLLVRDGLASSTQMTIPEIEIPLLLGQQFRSIVKSINNLSDIIIALECGMALSCKMHNLETATETNEDTLKGLLEQTVIVYVDNVIDDRLEITLYDTEGSKITIVSPDEGAYDSVEVLCPPLVLNSTLLGYVTHADELSVFIQPVEYASVISSLLDQMFETYDSQKQDLPIIPEEGLLYAVHSEDTNWYRGKVVSFDDEKATVSYIDYGNSEDVPFAELRELNDDFLKICILCVQVNVGGPTERFIDKDVIANIAYGDNGWEGTVELQTPGETSATESTEIETEEATGTATEIEPEPLGETRQVAEEVSDKQEVQAVEEVPELTADKPEVKGTQVLVSHVDTPNEFYIQLSESTSEVDELQANLQKQAPEMPILENPAAGVLCAAPYSVDQEWYRAEVLDADDDITTVRFVDYGNTDVIDNKTTEIKTLPPNLLSLAVYATRCSLKIKSPDEEWSAAALEAFEALTGAASVTVEFIDQDEKTNYVELYSNGENVKDALIRDNLGVPMELPADSKSTCFVSHLNSPSEFWIQLENCVEELEWIAEQLSSAETFPELEDLTPGTLCAALFPDDEMWYRARILSNTVAGIELLFIDYGSSCTSNSLRQLPEDLVVTAPLAQKCSLQKPDGIPYWTPQAAEKFAEISADGQTIFTVRKISTGETSVVQLLVEGVDVTSMLKPETEDGQVVSVEAEKLEIVKLNDALPESHRLEAMPGMTWTEESYKKLEELSNQGSTIFQIEFLPENVVRLYLDGKDIRLNLEAVKTLPLNVSNADVEDYDENELNSTIEQNDDALLKDTNATDNDKLASKGMLDITEEEFSEIKEVSELQEIQDDVKNLVDDKIPLNNDLIDTSQSQVSEKLVEVADENRADITEDKKDTPEDKDTPVTAQSQLSEKLVETTDESVGKDNIDNIGDLVKEKENLVTPQIPLNEEFAKTTDESAREDNTDNIGDLVKDKENLVTSQSQLSEELVKTIDESVGRETTDNDSDLVKDKANLVTSQIPLNEELVKTTDESAREDNTDNVGDLVKDKENLVTSQIPLNEELVKTTDESIGKDNTDNIGDLVEDKDNLLTPQPQLIEELVKTVDESVGKDKTDNDSDQVKDKDNLVTSQSQLSKELAETTDESIEKDNTDNVGDSVKDKENFASFQPQLTEKLLESPDKNIKEIFTGDKCDIVKDTENIVTDVQSPTISPSKGKCEHKICAEEQHHMKSLLNDEVEKALDKIDTKEMVSDEKISSQKEEVPKEISGALEDISSSCKEIDTSAELTSLLHEELDKALDKSSNSSRPSSRSSGKISHDERIPSAVVSRPHSPLDDEEIQSEVNTTMTGVSGKVQFDEKIVPGALSRPQSPLPEVESQK